METKGADTMTNADSDRSVELRASPSQCREARDAAITALVMVVVVFVGVGLSQGTGVGWLVLPVLFPVFMLPALSFAASPSFGTTVISPAGFRTRAPLRVSRSVRWEEVEELVIKQSGVRAGIHTLCARRGNGASVALLGVRSTTPGEAGFRNNALGAADACPRLRDAAEASPDRALLAHGWPDAAETVRRETS
jgi:hypothetical protein